MVHDMASRGKELFQPEKRSPHSHPVGMVNRSASQGLTQMFNVFRKTGLSGSLAVSNSTHQNTRPESPPVKLRKSTPSGPAHRGWQKPPRNKFKVSPA